MDKDYGVITFISKRLFLRRPRVANFADINKIATIVNTKTFKDSKKTLKNWKLFVKMQSLSVFLDIAKFSEFQ